VLLAVSGGISLGAYQGGVTWGLTQFFRSTSEAAFRAKYRTKREFKLMGMTGASAGNINSVFTAVEWCRDAARQDPETSLFWRAWTHVGWEQLYPQNPKLRDLSVYHRSYFQDKLYPEVGKRLTEKQRGCGLPVGIVVTKARPDTVNIEGLIDVPVQRLVSVVELSADSGAQGAFKQPVGLVHNGGLGDQFWLATKQPTPIIPSDDVLGLSAASSAFPVAFAQKELSYYPDSLITAAGTCPVVAGQCAPATTARFADGGVFDNDPLGFAYDLYRATQKVAAKPFPKTTHPWIIFISPDQRRRQDSAVRDAIPARQFAIKPAAKTPTDLREPQGLAAVVDLVGNAVVSGRKYELFSLSRSLSKSNDTVPIFGVTDRFQNAVGDYFNAFGAFLGRPFREFDYYIGVFDAFVFAAREVTCGRFKDPDLPKTTDSLLASKLSVTQRLALQRCTQTETRRMIEDPIFAINPVGRVVLSALYHAEYPALARPDTLPLRSLSDSIRAAELHALVDINDGLRVHWTKDVDDANCSNIGLVESLGCSGGFAELLREFGMAKAPGATSIRAMIDSLSLRPECAPDSWETAPDSNRCFADKTLADLLDNSTLALNHALLDVLDQLSTTEDSLRHARNERPASNSVSFLYRSLIAPVYQRGFHTSQSVFPRDISKAWYLIPYDIGFNMAAGNKPAGADLTYRVTLDYWNQVSFVMPARFIYQHGTGFGLAGIGLASKMFAGPVLIPLEANVAEIVPAGRSFRSERATAIELTLPILVAFRLRYRQLIHGDLSHYGEPRSIFTVGFNSLGGTLYWLLH
jgi:hypothetical protein